MEKLFIVLFAICMSTSGYSQKCAIKKGYAYERSSLSGTPPRKVLDESGNQIERPVKNNNTYFIYIESKRGRIFQPTRMWIAGKPFTVATETITHLPVIIQYEHPAMPADTLVRQTSNTVIRLLPQAELIDKPDARLAKKIAQANVVIEFTRNSRTFYYTIKDTKKLTPLVLQ